MSDLGALRRQLRERRRALSPAQRAAAQRSIVQRVALLERFQAARQVAAFMAFDGEVDISTLWHDSTTTDKHWYLPIMGRKTEPLRFALYRADESLQANRFGILEPAASVDRLIEPQALDLVLTPLVGFTEQGQRLGVGGGYYDRTFAFVTAAPDAPRPYLLGLAYEVQKCADLPVRPWDVMLDAVLTEAQIYIGQGGRYLE